MEFLIALLISLGIGFGDGSDKFSGELEYTTEGQTEVSNYWNWTEDE